MTDFPPSRTYISAWVLGGPGLGWEKCYVLGKESAANERRRRTVADGSVRRIGDHPRATTTGHALAQPTGQALPCRGRYPPVHGRAAAAARPARRGPVRMVPTGLPDDVNGPSLADRGPFPAGAQGARYQRV